MELNPRMQDSLELLELTDQVSVTELHMGAISGNLSRYRPKFNAGVKMIVYARTNCIVQGLSSIDEAVDRTPDGVRVERGDPIRSVLHPSFITEISYLQAMQSVARIYDLAS